MTVDARRRRLVFRCWHRGTREMDLILGRFADARVPTMDEGELEALERLLDVPDPDLFAWVTGRDAPVEHQGSILERLRAFHRDFPAAFDT